MKFLFSISLLIFINLGGYSQDISVGSSLDNLFRLTPYLDSSSTGMIRPYTSNSNSKSSFKNSFTNNYSHKSTDQKLLKVLPLEINTYFSQHHPFEFNDGSLIPARGFQTKYSAGFYIKKWFFEAQLNPEWVTAQNKIYDGFPEDHDQTQWRDYYRWFNNIELPERISLNHFTKLYPGQSFFRFKLGKVAAGISSQNLWWGPGQRNALLMSNTAPGFPHISIKTIKPIKTAIGNIEFETIWGRLTNVKLPPPDTMHRAMGILLYKPKQDFTRSIKGMVLTYSPKWIKGLAFGVEQTGMKYVYEMSGFKDYTPFRRPFKKLKTDDEETELLQTGLFFRYNIPLAGLEIYGELATNRSDRTLRELTLEPQSGGASIYGVRKLFQHNKTDYFELVTEFSTLQQQLKGDLFSASSWYVNTHVRQGYTNQGQLIGAGIGPGGKSQTIELNWRRNMNRLGVSFERIQHNNDLMIFTFRSTSDFRRFWTDFVFSMKSDWNYKRFFAGVNINFIKTNNYQWWLFEPKPGNYFIQGRDVYHFTGNLSLRYKIF